jgi:hypothetical protein
MVDGLTPIEGNHVAQAARGTAPSGPPKLFLVKTPAEDQLPDLPPAEVLDALDAAARVLDELDRKDISFRLDHDPSENRIRVHVGDGAAGTEREIPAGRLLNILAGDTSALSLDTRW